MVVRYCCDDYKVAIICALPLEKTAIWGMLDQEHSPPWLASNNDYNAYSFGRIGGHNVVIASLPAGSYGIASARGIAENMRFSFSKIQFRFLVGIAGGIPRPTDADGDIRLGDVVVGCINGAPAIVDYRNGRVTTSGFEIRSQLNGPPLDIETAIASLRSKHLNQGPTYLQHLDEMFRRHRRLGRTLPRVNHYNQPSEPDRLFRGTFEHLPEERDCRNCSKHSNQIVERRPRLLARPPNNMRNASFVKLRKDGYNDYPLIHYGTIASADVLLKSARERDSAYQIIEQQKNARALCCEMEAAGIVNAWPCLVVRGICDYADSHKNDKWQNFAAATAAAYTKDLIMTLPSTQHNPMIRNEHRQDSDGNQRLLWRIEEVRSRQHCSRQVSEAVASLQGDARLLVEARKYSDHMTLEAYAIYEDVYRSMSPNRSPITILEFARALGRKCPAGPKLVEVWSRFDSAADARYPESLVLAVLFMLHVEHWNPRFSTFRLSPSQAQLDCFRLMAVWAPCPCDFDCGLEWNFASFKYGIHRSVNKSRSPNRQRCLLYRLHREKLRVHKSLQSGQKYHGDLNKAEADQARKLREACLRKWVALGSEVSRLPNDRTDNDPA